MTTTEERFPWSKAAHIGILVIGALFILAPAFQSYVWFDESYSVAIAQHSFADIWSIGSNDVHPVLYYWALHVVYLIFGSNIVVYHIFSACGAIAMAVLGVTHIRRDFGARTGALFSFIVLLSPYICFMSLQIRMYSWAGFFVALVAIYAFRIGRRYAVEATSGARIPAHWWVAVFVGSLACAYLHYYAAMAAFVIDVMLLISLILSYRRTHSKAIRHSLLVLCVGAIATVAAYLPWIAELMGQVSHVSNGFWIEMSFPETLYEILGLPLETPAILAALQGTYGVATQVTVIVIAAVLAVTAIVLVVMTAIRSFRLWRNPSDGDGETRNLLVAAWCALVVFVSMTLIALFASLLINQPILCYRYLYIGLGPLLFFFAAVLSCFESRRFAWASRRAVTAVFSISLVTVAIVNQVLTMGTYYDSENSQGIDYYEQTIESLSEQQQTESTLVVTANIGMCGIYSMLEPNIPLYYLNVIDDTEAAYEAYAPTVTIVESLHDLLDDYQGQYVLLSSSDYDDDTSSIEEFAEEYSSSIVSVNFYSYPYYDTDMAYQCVAVLEK